MIDILADIVVAVDDLSHFARLNRAGIHRAEHGLGTAAIIVSRPSKATQIFSNGVGSRPASPPGRIWEKPTH